MLVSGKQSWCLVDTDAIDLTLPNANLASFGTGPRHVVRRSERAVDPRGARRRLGDTYDQYVAGQAFDITDLPNGTYYVRVHVNPLGAMFESNTANNVEDRLIRLRGQAR